MWGGGGGRAKHTGLLHYATVEGSRVYGLDRREASRQCITLPCRCCLKKGEESLLNFSGLLGPKP